MTAIQLDGFGGLAPVNDPRKLPPTGATIAHDCKFDGKDMRPLYAPLTADTLAFNICKLYKYHYKGAATWLAWPDNGTTEVDPVISPIADDTYGRLYWSQVDLSTINTPGAQNQPRYASQPTQGDITAHTSVIRTLGVAQPTVAPTLVEVQVANTITSASITAPTLTNMSLTSPVTVTAPNHIFQNGWRVVVAADTSRLGGDTGMQEMYGLQFTIGNVTASTFDLLGSDGSHYTPFVAGKTYIKISRVYLDADMETRSYVYTYVTDFGEEGQPSPPSTPQDIRYDSTVNLTFTAPTGTTTINRTRIYRTATGASGGGAFFFVAEVPLPAVTYSDSVKSISLGEVLPSTNWAPPPNGLRGLVQLPNGFMAGFVGNTLYFSEPYQPHAWPFEYTKTTEHDIVGLCVFGATLVIGTTGKPYLAMGTDPASVSMKQMELHAPCLNKGGLISTTSGAMFPTDEGLAFVMNDGPRILTLDQVARRQWSALWSTTMEAVFHDGRYIAFSRDPSKKTLIVETEFARSQRRALMAEYRQETGVNISDATVQGRAPSIDPDDLSLNFAILSGSSTTTRTIWEGGAARIVAEWQSKVFTLPHAVNLALGRVFASGYPVTLNIRYANLQTPWTSPTTGQTNGDSSDFYSIVVNGSEPFRLPGGFMSREYQVDVQSAFDVQSIILTDNVDDLRQQ